MIALLIVSFIVGALIGAIIMRATFDATSVFFGALVVVLGIAIITINWNAGFAVIYLGIGICFGPVASDILERW